MDPGLTATGWGVVEVDPRRSDRQRAVAHGRILPRVSDSLTRRLLTIREGLLAVLAAHGPAEAAVESLFFHKNAKSSLLIGHARGAALVALGEAGLPVAEYAPAEVKRALVGRGQASKEQVAYMVRAVLGVRGEMPEDAGDALAVAVCHLQRPRSGAAADAGARAASGRGTGR